MQLAGRIGHLVLQDRVRPENARHLGVAKIGKLVPDFADEPLERNRLLFPQDGGQTVGEGAVAGSAVPVLIGVFLLLRRLR